MTDEIYNPLDKLNLGKSVAEALLDRLDHPLGDIPSFSGAGIYVIYYRGDFPLYAPIAEANDDELRWPIYIGKAIPSGGRRGGSFLSAPTGNYLYNRLSEHRESINLANNINVEDFVARYLIVDDIWIPLGESLLISTFKPAWNQVLDGFGNHDPGKGRYQGMRPMWDMIHPGRPWAERMREHSLSVADLESRVSEFLDENAPPRSSHMKFVP